MQEQPPIPSTLSFLICDQIINEQGTNKKSLIGLFDQIKAKNVPATHGALWVYARLTDAQGEYTFRVDVVKLDTDKTIARATVPTTQIADRLSTTELVLRLPLLVLEAFGTYEFQLFANDVWIGRTILNFVPSGGSNELHD